MGNVDKLFSLPFAQTLMCDSGCGHLRIAACIYIFSFSPPDINECSTNNGGCAQDCANTQGSFSCSCRNGFQLASDGRGCNGKALLLAIHFLGLLLKFSPADINECNTNNGGCAYNCTNTLGSFMCSCRNGFQLASDGLGCDGMWN